MLIKNWCFINQFQTNKMQSNYFVKIGLPRGLSFWAVPAATPIKSNFTKKKPTKWRSDVLTLQINCLPYKNCILKAVYVAQERYCSFKFRSHWNYQSSYFNFHFCRLNSAPASLMRFMENWKMKTELIDRKKSTSNQNHVD